jgi:XTP/dITP diphosphohydrolase
MRLVIATGNHHKFEEFQLALAGLNLELLLASDMGIKALPPEMGASYQDNALMKAGFTAISTGLPSIADDSGLEVDALHGAPGIYSARFGGQLSSGERIAYLLAEMRDVPKGARSAKFVSSIVIATPNGESLSFDGECFGYITDGPRGVGGFGYDPVFFSQALNKTFAEASPEEKRSVSHRGKALKKFLEWALTPVGSATISDTSVPREVDIKTFES